ncbi:MAG TPA: alpha-glucan family phosphorylase [Solirubrobacteraceae bacterium]|nr:alpha-glucan family phosphorylase [Solirubrobacteraceae bacterium]
MTSGTDDLERAASALASRLPWPLAVLARLAYNYRWSWLPDGPEVFRAVDPQRWRACGGNPVRLLQEASAEALLRAANDAALIARAEATERAVREDLSRPARTDAIAEDRPVAYFSAEFAIHVSLPIYSGGLGALAGDVLKEASDLALPFVGVGLMYRRGYFRQRIDATGWQQEYWVPTDPERTPAVLVTNGADREPLRVTVPVGEQDVVAQVWRVEVGRVPLLLLDTDLPENERMARWITSRLYDGDPDTRLAQYAVLGIGGVQALRAIGVEPGVVHMNEGHAALAALESARAATDGGGFDAALDAVRRRTVFTTHTPVPAGNDTYPPEQVTGTLRRLAEGCGVDPSHFVRLARTHPDDEGEPFGVTQLALRSSRAANGVSRRHGGVARSMWQGLWPERAVDDVPIGHVTNGVHVPSWVGAPMRRLLDRHLGEGWAARAAEPDAFAAVEAIPDDELWAVRCEQRRLLVEFVRDRSVLDRAARGEPRHYAEAAAHAFDPDALTIGFARRVATYKRLYLLLHDLQRSLELIRGHRPVQFVLAGKAHPRDDEAKRVVQHVFGIRGEPGVAGRVVFLEDYDLGVAARLVRGCDVWVNVPRPPLEASGTSGMKSAINGGLQLSVLDGWWAEAYDGANGWALSGDEDHDHGAQDARDAAELQRVLAEEVLPEFCDRGDGGLPHAWLARVKRSMRTNVPAFSATRMLLDYERTMYRAA